MKTVNAIIDAATGVASTGDGGYSFQSEYEGYAFDISRDDAEDEWYIMVNPVEDSYLYEGWWPDSQDKTIEEAIDEAMRGSMILDHDEP